MPKKPKSRQKGAPSHEQSVQSTKQQGTTVQKARTAIGPARNGSPAARAKKGKATEGALQSKVLNQGFIARIEAWFKPWTHLIQHFFSPCIAGAATAGLLHLLDMAKPAQAVSNSLSGKFVNGSLEHVHAEVLLLGPFLLMLCVTMVGSVVARLLRKWLVLPLIQLGHHIFLAAAGALIAFFLLPHEEVMSKVVSAQLWWGVIFLLLGGAEMQGTEVVAKMPDEELTSHLGMWPTIILGAIGASVLGRMLWSQLNVPH